MVDVTLDGAVSWEFEELAEIMEGEEAEEDLEEEVDACSREMLGS